MTHSMEPFENLGNLHEDVGMFEAAVHAPRLEIPKVDVSSILLVLDGSNQDAPARSMAQGCARLLNAQVHERTQLDSAAAIRNCLQETAAQLLVLPAPFGRDIAELKDASLGDVVDLLLLEAGVPMLVVRQPLGDEWLSAALASIHVPLTPGEQGNALALAWACRLLRSGGELHVLEVADREVLREAVRLLGSPHDVESAGSAVIDRAMGQHFASLVAMIQRQATATGFTTHVATATGRFVAKTLEAIGDGPALVVLAGSRDHQSDAYHRACDLVLSSSGPLLIV